MTLWRCDFCPSERELFVRMKEGFACAACWHNNGRPFPKEKATKEQIDALVVATQGRHA